MNICFWMYQYEHAFLCNKYICMSKYDNVFYLVFTKCIKCDTSIKYKKSGNKNIDFTCKRLPLLPELGETKATTVIPSNGWQ